MRSCDVEIDLIPITVVIFLLMQKVTADFSKFRLQSKSKMAALNAQAEAAQKAASESMERVGLHWWYFVNNTLSIVRCC